MGTTKDPNGLRQLSSAYASDSSDDDSDREVEDESSDTVSSIKSPCHDAHMDDEDEEDNIVERAVFVPKTEGELLLQDLPPIEDLKISVASNTLACLGTISAIVEKQIIVQSNKDMPPLNIDSVLFFADGQPIGQIFDVLGQVKEPSYSIRFNTEQDITLKQLEIDMPVYFAPSADKSITSFVFVNQLRKIKGTDASWKDNNEPPEHLKEYSDDEEERRAKSKLRSRNENQNEPYTNNSLSPKRTRHGRV